MKRFRLPDAPKEWSQDWGRQLVRSVEQELDRMATPAQAGYSVTGALTQTRTLDVDTATAAQVRTFLGQLTQDLRDRGLLG